MADNVEEPLQMVEDCESNESKLSNWERSFIQSCRERLGEDKPLTGAQREKLAQIWERIC